MKKIFKNKIIIVGVVITLIIISVSAYILISMNKEAELVFQKGVYEYGTDVNFKKMIKESKPEDAEIVYPDVKVESVGKYNVEFIADGDEIKHTFIVTDTQLPILELHKESNVEILIGSDYNVSSNFKSASDKVDGQYELFEQVDEVEYKKRKENVEESKKIVNERDHTANKKTVEKDLSMETTSGYVFYTTDMDSSVEGIYKVKAVIVDKNFNITTKKWNVNVMPLGSIVNTGGVVSCDYTGPEGTNEKIDTKVKQVYNYNDKKAITNVSTIATYTLAPGYTMKSNIDIVVAGVEETYAAYKDKQGVTMNTEIIGNNTVIFTISMDIITFGIGEDGIPFLPEFKSANLIEDVIKNASSNNMVCDSK